MSIPAARLRRRMVARVEICIVFTSVGDGGDGGLWISVTTYIYIYSRLDMIMMMKCMNS
jgi:hypothetical protein